MGIFERFLSLWVALAIAVGVGLGLVVPGLFEVVARFEWASVNLVVAVLIWLMIYPMMLKVEPSCLKDVGKKPKGLALTLVVNWLIKPFTMAALGVLFFQHIFAGLVPLEDAQQYIAGMILLGVAPCTAMVFVWSHLTDGDANYTLVQVSVNDIILVFAFAPIAGLLLGVTDLSVPWGDAARFGCDFRRHPARRRGADPQTVGAGREHGGHRAPLGQAQAHFDCRVVAYCRASLRLSGRDDRGTARTSGADRHTSDHSELQHLCHRVRNGSCSEAALRCRGASRNDWYVQLLRVGGRRGHKPLWSRFGRRARDRSRRAHRGTRHALARRFCQPHQGVVSCRSCLRGRLAF